MRKYRRLLLQSCALLGTLAFAANAETVTYSYDELGRLKASAVSGGSNNGTSTAVCYDKAGNRQKYVSAVAAAATCTPTPSPTPTPAP